jgi:DNA polymerase III delta subunit
MSLNKSVCLKTCKPFKRRTNNVFLVYGEDELVVHGYLNASFQSDVENKKKSIWLYFTLNNGVVS